MTVLLFPTEAARSRTASSVRALPVRVSEVSGPALQGRGPYAGRPAVFVRLMGCNLSCPPCETPHTWDRSRFDLAAETRRTDTATVLDEVLAHPTGLVVLTGGEPLRQIGAVCELAAGAIAAGRRVEVETNGTFVPPPELLASGVFFTVSPKLPWFGAPAWRRLNTNALRVFAGYDRARFAFPVRDIRDLDEVTALTEEFALAPVWILPAGRSHDEVSAQLRILAEPVVSRGWNLSGRIDLTLQEGTHHDL